MKATNAVVLTRTSQVAKLLIEGKGREHIVQYGSENWGVGERQTDKYIKKAKDIIARDVVKNVKYDYAKALMRYEHLFELAISRNDYRAAVLINKEIASLQGLYKTKVEHSGEVKFISGLPD